MFDDHDVSVTERLDNKQGHGPRKGNEGGTTAVTKGSRARKIRPGKKAKWESTGQKQAI